MSWLNWNDKKKETISPREAIERVEEHRQTQRKKIAQSLALRAAQLKYLVNRAKESPWNEWTALRENSPLFPPMRESAIIDFALHAHALFRPTIYNEWISKARRLAPNQQPAFAAWIAEWNELLEEMRRTVVQNLSGRAEEKIFEEMQLMQKIEDAHALERENEFKNEKSLGSARDKKEAVEIKIAELESRPEFQSVRATAQTQDELQQQKNELEQTWMRNWQRIQPVFEILSNDHAFFDGLEMSAVQLLQNYVKNPWQARARDAHASGLKMILDLALKEVQKNEWPLPTAQMQEYERRLQQAKEEKFFEYYFWKANEVESAWQAVRKELEATPYYRQHLQLQITATTIGKEIARLQDERTASKKRQAGLEQARRQKVVEINALIPPNWNWQIGE